MPGPRLLVRPGPDADFCTLQYTFLSQVGYREDFRQRLAALYEEWRGRMAEGVVDELTRRPSGRTVSPRALSTLVQAILHGLAKRKSRVYVRRGVILANWFKPLANSPLGFLLTRRIASRSVPQLEREVEALGRFQHAHVPITERKDPS